jgi:hypothetical protein
MLNELGVDTGHKKFKEGYIGEENDTNKYNQITPFHMCILAEFLLRRVDEMDPSLPTKKLWFFMTVESILYDVEELPKITSTYQKMSFK